MIQIYTNSNPDVSKNGIIIDSIAISCTINPKLNGENELEMECYINRDGLYKYIQFNNYISVLTPDFDEPQLYRIYDTKKSMSGYSITAYARHIEFDLAKCVIFNKNVTGNGQQVLTKLLEDTPFTGTSNITDVTDIRQYKLRTVMNVLAGSEDDSFINIWGGEISCNNYDLTINKTRGSDKGIRVTFGYNLEDIEEELNFDDVITRIYPYAGDIVLSSNTPYVDSPLIRNIGVLEESYEFSDIKVKDSDSSDTSSDSDSSDTYFDTQAEAEAEMIKRCEKLYDKGLDKIVANYTIKMQDLSKTTEYKALGYDVLEKICLGDTVHCYNKNIDIEVEARCISYKWDCINQEYTEIELGDFISSYVNMQNDRLDNLYRKIVMTEQSILLEVDSLDNTLTSKIEITAGQIRSEVADTKEGLESSITQTASEIRSEVSNSVSGLNTKIDQTASSITSTVSDTKNQLESEIKQTSDSITSTITDKTNNLQTQITQNTDNIKSCVTKDQFGSYIEQNADSIVESIKDTTGDHTCTFDSNGLTVQNGGFKIKNSNGTTVLWMDTNGYIRLKDLNLENSALQDGALFSTSLNNLESLHLGKLYIGSKFVINDDYFYINGFDDTGWNLKEYVNKVLQSHNLI